MMKACRVWVVLAFPLLVGSCASTKSEVTKSPVSFSRCIEVKATSTYSCKLSLVELLTNATAYDGKRVIVGGYIHFGFEDQAIYLHRDDYDSGLSKNGLWVDWSDHLDEKQCQDSYVLIEGTFNASDYGHLGAFSGAIKDVNKCQKLPIANRP